MAEITTAAHVSNSTVMTFIAQNDEIVDVQPQFQPDPGCGWYLDVIERNWLISTGPSCS
ncbi:hypothetical protein HFN93_09245 [Rhizobium laguerreae]|nr:hypothetical protein [Rhizobium laguerreae]MCA2406826.1 hypothetical protein [Rhizobium leguminosarum]MBY3384348.1 hypothetical protein [Rhizobium laguerreae]MBY3398009.1 hypothetical protein [Rhizobium laguerreae]MBY3404949.1 hypothetical protein [Rhizobium laguerreae]